MEDNHVRRLPLQRSDKYLVDWMFLPSKLNVLSVNSFFLSSITFIASAFPQFFLFLFGEKKKKRTIQNLFSNRQTASAGKNYRGFSVDHTFTRRY